VIPYRYPSDIQQICVIPYRYPTDTVLGMMKKKTQISSKNPPSVLLHLVKPSIMGLIRIGPKLSFCLAWALIPIKSQSPMALGFMFLPQ
jgi:hypothetical protein